MSGGPTPHPSRGIGIATLMAVVVPVLVLIGSLALSMQSSAARRFLAGEWMAYAALEVAESAIGEASHTLRLDHIFDPATAVFGPYPDRSDVEAYLGANARPGTAVTGRDITTATEVVRVLRNLVADAMPGLPATAKEYRHVLRSDGSRARSMLVAFRFPQRRVRIEVPGLAARIARETPGVVAQTPDDLAVHVRPLSFRREFYRGLSGWVNWGVLQFEVRVKVRDVRGTSAYRVTVDRRFSLRPLALPNKESIKVSQTNLRTLIVREGA